MGIEAYCEHYSKVGGPSTELTDPLPAKGSPLTQTIRAALDQRKQAEQLHVGEHPDPSLAVSQ